MHLHDEFHWKTLQQLEAESVDGTSYKLISGLARPEQLIRE